jgi:hypothetical protein
MYAPSIDKRGSRRSGQSLIEVTVGIIVLIPAVLVLLDLAFVIYGVERNDSACQNAARAAASGPPAEAQARAQTALDRVNGNCPGGIVSSFQLVLPLEMKISRQPMPERDEYTGQLICHGGPVIGSATVSTEVEVRPFLVHYICTGKTPLKFRATQTFPISYIMSASADTAEKASNALE